MTTTTVTRTCDCCGKELQKGETGFLKLEYSVKDWMGNYCALSKDDFKDLCDNCADAIHNYIVDLKKLKGGK